MRVEMRTRTTAKRAVALAATVVLVAGVAGCSVFRWGAEKPIDDAGNPSPTAEGGAVAQAGVAAGSGGASGEAASAGAPSEPAAAATTTAEAKAAATAASDAELHSAGLRKIAIFPVAYADAGGGYGCDLCPESVKMEPTSAAAARLTTAFFYENVARHPRFLTVRYETAVAAASKGMRAAAADLSARGQADAVLIAALVALRPRVGDDEAPEQPAGAALFASLVDARSGEVLWSGTFDRDEKARNRFGRFYDKVVGGVPRKWHSAEGFTEVGVKDLVEDMVDEVGD